ncbi:MAG: hypothetical protein ACEQSR_03850 [Candidatus Methylacidiphilales bacterium]
MNITLSITGATAAEIKQAVQELSNSFAINVNGELLELKSEKVEITEKVTKEKKAVVKEDTAKVETPVVANTDAAVTLEQVRAAVQAKANNGKRVEVKAILTECGAENVTSLASEKYVEFLTKVNAL